MATEENNSQTPTGDNNPQVAAERVKTLYDVLSKDEVFKDAIPSDFQGFVNKFKEPKQMALLYDVLSKDEVFKEVIPDSPEKMYDKYVLGKSKAESAKEPSQSLGGQSPLKEGAEFGLNQAISSGKPKPNVLAEPQPLAPQKEKRIPTPSEYAPKQQVVAPFAGLKQSAESLPKREKVGEERYGEMLAGLRNEQSKAYPSYEALNKTVNEQAAFLNQQKPLLDAMIEQANILDADQQAIVNSHKNEVAKFNALTKEVEEEAKTLQQRIDDVNVPIETRQQILDTFKQKVNFIDGKKSELEEGDNIVNQIYKDASLKNAPVKQKIDEYNTVLGKHKQDIEELGKLEQVVNQNQRAINVLNKAYTRKGGQFEKEQQLLKEQIFDKRPLTEKVVSWKNETQASLYNTVVPSLVKSLGAAYKLAAIMTPLKGDMNALNDIVGDKILKFGDDIEVSREDINKMTGFENPYAEKALYDEINPFNLSKGIANVIGSVGMTLAGGGALGRTALTVASKKLLQRTGGQAAAFAQIYGNSYEDGIKAGLKNEQALMYASAIALPSAVLEQFGVSKLFDLAATKGGKKILQEAILSELKKNGGKMTAKEIFDFTSKKVVQLLASGAVEGSVEVSQTGAEFLAKLGTEAITDADFEGNLTMNDFKRQAYDSFVLGFGAGGASSLAIQTSPQAINTVAAEALTSPEKMQDFKDNLESLRINGKINEEGYAAANTALNKAIDVSKTVPATITDVDDRKTAIDLIQKRDELTAQLETIDPDLAAPIQEELKNIKGELQDLAKGVKPKTEESAQPTTAEEQAITETVNEDVIAEPTLEQIEKDIESDNIVRFTYTSEAEIPEFFKDKVSSVQTDNDGNKKFNVSIPKSRFDYFLKTENIEQDGTPKQQTTQTTENAVQEQPTTQTIPRPVEGGQNIPESSQGVRPSEQGKETAQQGKEEVKLTALTDKDLASEILGIQYTDRPTQAELERLSELQDEAERRGISDRLQEVAKAESKTEVRTEQGKAEVKAPEIILSGAAGGFKSFSRKAFDLRNLDGIRQAINENISFAKIFEYKGKKYIAVGLVLSIDSQRGNPNGRNNYSFAVAEINESTPSNIVETLENSAKENFKNLYKDFSVNDSIEPITTTDAEIANLTPNITTNESKNQSGSKENAAKNENGIQEGGKNGNENVSESVQGKGKDGGQKVNVQDEGQLQVETTTPSADLAQQGKAATEGAKNPALKDVESTAKALSSNILSEDTIDEIEDLYLRESGKYKGFFTRMGDLLFTKSKGVDVKNMTQQSLREKGIDPVVFNKERNEFLKNNENLILSEYYHKAKKEKSDAEFVKAFEEIINKQNETKTQENIPSATETDKGGEQSVVQKVSEKDNPTEQDVQVVAEALGIPIEPLPAKEPEVTPTKELSATEKKIQEFKEKLKESIDNVKSTHKELYNQKLGFFYNPSEVAKKQYAYHMALKNVAINAIQLGVANIQQFSAVLGNKVIDGALRLAWRDANAEVNGGWVAIQNEDDIHNWLAQIQINADQRQKEENAKYKRSFRGKIADKIVSFFDSLYDNRMPAIRAVNKAAVTAIDNLANYAPQGNVAYDSDALKQEVSKKAKRIFNLLDLIPGAKSYAESLYNSKGRKIFKGLSVTELEDLSRVIDARTVISIDTRFDKKKADDIARLTSELQNATDVKEINRITKELDEANSRQRKKHTADSKGTQSNLETATAMLELMEQNNPLLYKKINDRAEMYFDLNRELLIARKDAGLISNEQFDALINNDYSKRQFLEHILDDGSSVNKGVKFGNKSYLSGDIKSLEDGSIDVLLDNKDALLKANILQTARGIFSNNARVGLLDFIRNNPNNGQFSEQKSNGVDEYGNATFSNEGLPKGYGQIFAKETEYVATQDFTVNGVDFKQGQKLTQKEYSDLLNDSYGLLTTQVKAVGGKRVSILAPIKFIETFENPQLWVTPNMRMFLRTISFAGVTSALAVGVNPLFIFSNIPADFVHTLSHSPAYRGGLLPIKALKLAKDMLSVSKDAFSKGKIYQEAMRAGVGFNTLSMDANPFEANFSADNRGATKVLSDLYNGLSYLGNSSELTTRLAIFERTKKNAIREFKKNNRGKNPNELVLKEIEQQAAYAARSIMDYSKKGNLADAIGTLVPFFNASIRGLDSTVQSLKNDPVGTLGTYAQLAAGAALLLMYNLSYKDDDDEEAYGKVPMEDKVNNFVIMLPIEKEVDGKKERAYLKIKKTQSVQLLINSTEQNLLSLMGRKTDYKVIGQSFKNNFAIPDNVLSVPSIKVAMALNTGYDEYRDDFVWKGDENVSKPMQYNVVGRNKTDKMLVDVGEKTGMAPVNIELALKQIAASPKNNLYYKAINSSYNQLAEGLTEEEKLNYDSNLLNGLGSAFVDKFVRFTYPKKDAGKIDIKKETTRVADKEQKINNEFKIITDLYVNKKYSKNAKENETKLVEKINALIEKSSDIDKYSIAKKAEEFFKKESIKGNTNFADLEIIKRVRTPEVKAMVFVNAFLNKKTDEEKITFIKEAKEMDIIPEDGLNVTYKNISLGSGTEIKKYKNEFHYWIAKYLEEQSKFEDKKKL